ncbi:hypothetical protein [Photobacterium minamisatsumaniensis]|uniref:hypothetical protein n=1 Tax=Photobacterium minamisatsumaniensis TaxID=2910233 RepID=UPI003D13AC92
MSGVVVGVELAGEIAYAFPEKKTVLAHNTGVLLDGFKDKTRRITLDQLKNLGVDVAKSIVKKLKNKKVKGYKRNPLIALIPTGQKSGIAELPFAVTTFKPLINMKQKDLFITKVYTAFGA